MIIDETKIIPYDNEMETFSNHYISSCLVLITFLE